MSFYAAIIVAFNAHGFLEPLVIWGLIVREVALYITRILHVDKLPEIERIRPSTNHFVAIALEGRQTHYVPSKFHVLGPK